MKQLPYILIAILLVIILLQNQCNGPKSPKETRDTVIVYEKVHDTIPGKPLPPTIEKDTVWLTRTKFTPDTTYSGLLRQYNFLGNKLFEKKTYSTPFKIADYGSITVNDTIKGNELIGSSIVTNLTIPTTTITITKETPPKNKLFLGIEATGNKSGLNGIYIGPLLKTKKDRIYSISIGYTDELNYKGGIYWPLNFK